MIIMGKKTKNKKKKQCVCFECCGVYMLLLLLGTMLGLQLLPHGELSVVEEKWYGLYLHRSQLVIWQVVAKFVVQM